MHRRRSSPVSNHFDSSWIDLNEQQLQPEWHRGALCREIADGRQGRRPVSAGGPDLATPKPAPGPHTTKPFGYVGVPSLSTRRFRMESIVCPRRGASRMRRLSSLRVSDVERSPATNSACPSDHTISRAERGSTSRSTHAEAGSYSLGPQVIAPVTPRRSRVSEFVSHHDSSAAKIPSLTVCSPTTRSCKRWGSSEAHSPFRQTLIWPTMSSARESELARSHDWA